MPSIYETTKRFFINLTEAFLLLIALSVVASIVFGSELPFVGGVTDNLIALIQKLGEAGLVGLIAAGIIIWLVTKRA